MSNMSNMASSAVNFLSKGESFLGIKIQINRNKKLFSCTSVSLTLQQDSWMSGHITCDFKRIPRSLHYQILHLNPKNAFQQAFLAQATLWKTMAPKGSTTLLHLKSQPQCPPVLACRTLHQTLATQCYTCRMLTNSCILTGYLVTSIQDLVDISSGVTAQPSLCNCWRLFEAFQLCVVNLEAKHHIEAGTVTGQS